jgi:hypothetical protein
VSSQWPARQGKTGKNYGKRWEETRAPWVSDDFDWTYYNAAPPDQRLDGYLRGDEVVWFQHLHPKAPRFEVRLPGLRLRALVKRTDGTVHDLTLVLDTLVADTDAGRLELLWRGHCPVTQVDLSDVKIVLIASEPLAEPPTPGAHWLSQLEAFEADPIGIKAKLPPGFMEVAEAVQAAEKAEKAGTPGPDFAAVAARLPKDGPIPPWAVVAFGALSDPMKALVATAEGLGVKLPTDPAALAAIAEKMKKDGKEPAALAEHLDALAAQLPPDTATSLRGAAAKLRQVKAAPPAGGADPAATLAALADGLPADVGATLRGAAATVGAALADAAAAAGGAALARPAPARPPRRRSPCSSPPSRPSSWPPPPRSDRRRRPRARPRPASSARSPPTLDAEVGKALAPLAAIQLPSAPDARALVAPVVGRARAGRGPVAAQARRPPAPRGLRPGEAGRRARGRAGGPRQGAERRWRRRGPRPGRRHLRGPGRLGGLAGAAPPAPRSARGLLRPARPARAPGRRRATSPTRS